MVTIVGSAKSAVMTGVSYPSLLHLWSGELVYYIAVPLMIIQFCPRGPCGCAIQLPTMTSSFCRVCLADLRDSLRRRRLFLSEDALRLTLFRIFAAEDSPDDGLSLYLCIACWKKIYQLETDLAALEDPGCQRRTNTIDAHVIEPSKNTTENLHLQPSFFPDPVSSQL